MGLISTVGIGITEALALRYSQAINYSFLIRTVILFTFCLHTFSGRKTNFKEDSSSHSNFIWFIFIDRPRAKTGVFCR